MRPVWARRAGLLLAGIVWLGGGLYHASQAWHRSQSGGDPWSDAPTASSALVCEATPAPCQIRFVRTRGDLRTLPARPGGAVLNVCLAEMGSDGLLGDGPPMPSPMILAACNDLKLIEEFGVWCGQGYRKLGIDLVIGPDASPAQGASDNSTTAAAAAGAYAAGLLRGGVVPVFRGQLDASALPLVCQALVPLTGSLPQAPPPAATSCSLLLLGKHSRQTSGSLLGGETRQMLHFLRSGGDAILCPPAYGRDLTALRLALAGQGVSLQAARESSRRLQHLHEFAARLRAASPPVPDSWAHTSAELVRRLLEHGAGESGGLQTSQSLQPLNRARMHPGGVVP